MPVAVNLLVGLVASSLSGATSSGIRQYGFLTHFEVSPAEARQRVRQLYNVFGILDFQFYDAFYNYSQPMPATGDTWISKPSGCFTPWARLVRKETIQAYTDEIRKLPGGRGRSWLYVQAVAADEPASQLPQFSPWLYKSGDQVAWTFESKCLYVYKLTPHWADRMVELWAPAAVDLGFDGIHWDQLGRVSDDPFEVAEMAASMPTFLQITRVRLLMEYGLKQTFNFVDGFGWHASLYTGTDSSVVEFPYWECWNDQTEWIFWSLFNFSAGGHAVFARYPDPECCSNPTDSNAEANLLTRWERAGSACVAYLVLGDDSRRLKREYFPVNVGINTSILDEIKARIAAEPAHCGISLPVPDSSIPWWRHYVLGFLGQVFLLGSTVVITRMFCMPSTEPRSDSEEEEGTTDKEEEDLHFDHYRKARECSK